MRGGCFKEMQPRMQASTEIISYFCATDRSSIVSSRVGGRTAGKGKMKVRRVERIAPLSGSCRTGRCGPASVEMAGCEGSEMACMSCICRPRTGELLIIYSFSTWNSCESQERRMISASGSSMNVLRVSSSGVEGGGGVVGDRLGGTVVMM